MNGSMPIVRAAVCACLSLLTPALAQSPGFESDEQQRARQQRERTERESREYFERSRLAAEKSEIERALQRAAARVAFVRVGFEGAPAIGAGLLLGRDKDRLYVVTANHVVRRGASVAAQVQLHFKNQPASPRQAQVLPQHDAELDLAVLAVDAARPQHEVDLCADSFFDADSARLPRGAAVLPLGHPNGVRWLVPASPDALLRAEGDSVLFQSQLLSPGHSGGALLTADAYWLGMLTADAPPFGRAISAAAIVRKLIEWRLPVLVLNNSFRSLIKAIEDGDTTQLARQLEVCDPNEWGSEYGPPHRELGLRLPLEVAIRARRSAVVQLLLSAGASPNVTLGREGTLMHLAAGRGTVEIVRLLLAAGGKPDAVYANTGLTPLMLAALGNRIATARVLLDAGADVKAVSKEGKSALSLAAKHPEMQQLLRERGATD